VGQRRRQGTALQEPIDSGAGAARAAGRGEAGAAAAPAAAAPRAVPALALLPASASAGPAAAQRLLSRRRRHAQPAGLRLEARPLARAALDATAPLPLLGALGAAQPAGRRLHAALPRQPLRLSCRRRRGRLLALCRLLLALRPGRRPAGQRRVSGRGGLLAVPLAVLRLRLLLLRAAGGGVQRVAARLLQLRRQLQRRGGVGAKGAGAAQEGRLALQLLVCGRRQVEGVQVRGEGQLLRVVPGGGQGVQRVGHVRQQRVARLRGCGGGGAGRVQRARRGGRCGAAERQAGEGLPARQAGGPAHLRGGGAAQRQQLRRQEAHAGARPFGGGVAA
jgi:hypothetical protein